MATYDAYLTLVDRLTNPSAGAATLRGHSAASRTRPNPPPSPGRGLGARPGVLLAPGLDLILKLYGDRPIPEGFSLVDEMVRRIRSGAIDLKPTGRSGWYDYQTWALEPLVVPEKMPEASRLRLAESYRKALLDLFKGVLALTRETHVKQLLMPAAAEAPPVEPRVIVYVHPELAAEPLVSYYRRRAGSYEFIREALLATFGPAGLAAMHRQTASGPVVPDLAAELDAVRALFSGASETTARQLGMDPDPKLDADVAALRSWAKGAADDPDVGRDARMMVPVFYDVDRRKTKVSGSLLGWYPARPNARHVSPPRRRTKSRANGRKLDAKDSVEVKFAPSFYQLAYPVTAEVYVDELLDRDQFRKLCDTYKTRAAILGHLK